MQSSSSSTTITRGTLLTCQDEPTRIYIEHLDTLNKKATGHSFIIRVFGKFQLFIDTRNVSLDFIQEKLEEREAEYNQLEEEE